jgi:hypothetical protein
MHAPLVPPAQHALLKTSRRQRRPWSELGGMLCQHHWTSLNLVVPAHFLMALPVTRTYVVPTLLARNRLLRLRLRLGLARFGVMIRLLNAGQGLSAGMGTRRSSSTSS